MRFRDLVPEFKITLSDLMWTALVVSPIWLTLGLLSGDIVTIAAAIAAAVVSALHVRPGLVARLRGA
jgi:hypothetical protein